jgi:hypothetical protein
MVAARRAFACVLALVLLGEVSGVARAFGPGASVRCCCGAHASARPCPCPDCPAGRVRSAKGAAPRHSCLGAGRHCDGSSADDPGVLLMLAALPAPPALAAAAGAGRLDFAAPLPPRGRGLDPRRPPP